MIGGRPVTEDEMATLARSYLLKDSAFYICQMGPAFQESIDGDDVADDDEDELDEDKSDATGLEDDDTYAGDAECSLDVYGFCR